MLLKLCAGKFLHAAWSRSAILAAAQHPLALEQEDATCSIAEDRNLQARTELSIVNAWSIDASHALK